MASEARPSKIRWLIVGLTTCVAVLLYLDRFCLGFVAPYIRENLGLTKQQMGFVLDAFFYTYAIGQIPCGWISDRYGTRLTLALYLAIWSSLTGLMGLAQGLTLLVLLRFGCGLFEAGAYPASAGLIRRWVPYDQRALASSIVSIGGRIGGAVVPVLTAYLMVSFVPVSAPSQFTRADLLDATKLVEGLYPPAKSPQDATLGEWLGPRFRAALPVPANTTTRVLHLEVQQQVAELAEKHPDDDQSVLIEKVELHPTEKQETDLIDGLNHLLKESGLVGHETVEHYRHKLPAEAIRLSEAAQKRDLTPDERARFHRLVLEAAFPDALRKIYGEGWRPALLIYGSVGILLAVVFFALVRDSARQHPLANDAEARLIEASAGALPAPAGDSASAGTLWHGIVTSRSLWLSAFVQFGTNFGWIFLGNLFPTYLKEAHGVPELERGWMVTLPFAISLPMMIVGGVLTDRLTRRIGPRWGRCLPVALSRLVASAAFFTCLAFDAPWPITFALIVFSVASDMGLPALWAFCLDVGGKNVGLVLGWGNMWGNLGAAVSTSTLIFLRGSFPGPAGWDAVFLVCGVVFLIIGIASFGIDATRPIVRKAAD